MRVLKYLSAIRPERFFVIMGCCFGLIFLLFTPPFQVPDEMNHFYRSYQLSEGRFIPLKQNNRVGGELPLSLKKISEPFFYISWHPDVTTSFQAIKATLQIPLRPDKKEFIDFPNTAMYSPVCYAPQAIAIFIFRLFGFSPLALFYAARLFALLFWLVVVRAAIRLLPVYKWAFVFVALLPMSVFINAALSADVVTNAMSFLCLAFILKLAYGNESITSKRFVQLCVLCFLLVSVKLVYAPLLLAGLIIPISQFKSKKDYVLKLAALVLIATGTALLWSSLMNSLYTPYAQYDPVYRDMATVMNGADMYQQKEYILSHGSYIFDVLVRSVSTTFYMYFPGYIGTFGWLDTQLPAWFIYSMYGILFILLLLDGGTIKIAWWHRVLFLLGFVLSAAAMLISQHLTWDVVGGDTVYTVQGRYLIPFAPLLFLLFYTRIDVKKIVAPLVMLCCIMSLTYCCYVLYMRYFGAGWQ